MRGLDGAGKNTPAAIHQEEAQEVNQLLGPDVCATPKGGPSPHSRQMHTVYHHNVGPTGCAFATCLCRCSGSPVFIDIRTAKTTRPPTWGMMAAAYGSSPRSFRLLGLVHGHFGDDILPDAVADDGRQKLHINTGIAMVVPAEKIREALAGYASAEEIEENDFRRRHGSFASVTPVHNPTSPSARSSLSLHTIDSGRITPEMQDLGEDGRRSRESWMIASVPVTTGIFAPQLTNWKCKYTVLYVVQLQANQFRPAKATTKQHRRHRVITLGTHAVTPSVFADL